MGEEMENLDDLWPPFGHPLPHRGGAPRPAGRRPSPLSRDQIIRAAVSVADAEGADAVNMRRIARELDVGTMSLYWHVADKDQLLDLMLDDVEGEHEPLEPTGHWRHDLAQIARGERANLLRHRWVMDFIGGRPPLGPNTLLRLERSLAVLDRLDLDSKTAIDILMTVNTYVMGAVLRELREMRAEHDDVGGDAGVRAGIMDWLFRLQRSGLFERVLRMLNDEIDPDSPDTRDERFEFGLRCVLDGIAANLT